MKSKITRKLVLYFLIIILLFSVVSGVLFLKLGKRNLEESSLLYLENRADRISTYISKLLINSEENFGMGSMMGRMSGQGHMKHSPSQNSIRLMNELLDTDIRIVSKDEKYIESGIDKKPIDFDLLNDSEKNIVNEAFKGNISSTKESSFLGGKTSVTVAAPVILDGEIVSVLLLNEQNTFTSKFLDSAKLVFLTSTIIGAILVAILAIFFANRFIQPLNDLNLTTKRMIDGNYKVTSGVEQNDEIGDLAICIDKLALRLEDAKEQTHVMNQMKDDFISSMSHELKTPVTVIKSSLEALKDGVISKDEEVREYHEILYDEIGVLERLINDLMDLNILKNKKYNMIMEEVNVIDILNDAIRSQTP